MNPLSTKTEADLMVIIDYCNEMYWHYEDIDTKKCNYYNNIAEHCTKELENRIQELSKQLNTEG